MRPLLSALLSTALLVGTAAESFAQSQPCARTAEKAAFDLAGLKSQLMVVAISCQAEEKYNAFVVRFRPDLVSGEKGLNAYFGRTSRSGTQRAHDDYITSLANTQSEDGLKRGTLFCTEHLTMFDDVMRLKDGGDLRTYAAGKNIVQPIDLTECPAPPPPAPKKTKSKTVASNAG